MQIERSEQAMEKTGVRPGRKVCEAMRGLVEEAQHEIEEHDEKGRCSIWSSSGAAGSGEVAGFGSLLILAMPAVGAGIN